MMKKKLGLITGVIGLVGLAIGIVAGKDYFEYRQYVDRISDVVLSSMNNEVDQTKLGLLEHDLAIITQQNEQRWIYNFWTERYFAMHLNTLLWEGGKQVQMQALAHKLYQRYHRTAYLELDCALSEYLEKPSRDCYAELLPLSKKEKNYESSPFYWLAATALNDIDSELVKAQVVPNGEEEFLDSYVGEQRKHLLKSLLEVKH